MVEPAEVEPQVRDLERRLASGDSGRLHQG